jgi:hypothetical protein
MQADGYTDMKKFIVLFKILQTRLIQRRGANWIFHVFCKNGPLKQAVRGKKGKQGKICKQLRDYLKETRKYWKLKEEALDRFLLRTRLGRGYGPVFRHYVTIKALVTKLVHVPLVL